jgi:hypothetical protein
MLVAFSQRSQYQAQPVQLTRTPRPLACSAARNSRLRLHMNGSWVLQTWPVHAHTSVLLSDTLNLSAQLAARQLVGAVEEARSNLLKAE